NYTEQEIIIIDLTPPKTIDSPEGKKQTAEGDYDWWCKCNKGVIDPRPRVMFSIQKSFNCIFDHGGLFVIFAQPRLTQSLRWAKLYLGNLSGQNKDMDADNWSFLSILSPYDLEIQSDFGEEIVVPQHDHQLFRFLRKNIEGVRYTATFKLTSRREKLWAPILSDKYERCVGGLIIVEESKSCVLILPQLANKAEVVSGLLSEVLPELSPHLFPHIEGARWVERDEYELESLRDCKRKKKQVQERVKRELEEIDKQVANEREQFGFLHGILTQTGSDLVKSVELCLRMVGFENVVNVDEKIASEKISTSKQEDLQVLDSNPRFVIEVKGLSGLAQESDILQVFKYVNRRMKEWDSRDVHGVSIINHQRNLPALDRNNEKAFSDLQIADAKDNEITLLTTWDLFLLIRGMMKYGWDTGAIRALFFKEGRLERIPTIYQRVGEVVKYWDKPSVVGVEVSGSPVRKDQRIGYVVPDGFLEETIVSLQIDNEVVEQAIPGQSVGIETRFSKNQLRKGTIVCIRDDTVI
ncbi:hypothetical protein KA005_53150, partial [bacterium]|nr:hypothetical protein [bacterium]